MTATFQIVNGDFVVNAANGRWLLVADETKLAQDMTGVMSMEAPPGAGLEGLIGSLSEVVHAEASRRITGAFTALQRLQQRVQYPQRTRGELLARLQRVDVAPARLSNGAVAQTAYIIQITVIAGSGKPTTAAASVGTG